MSSSKLKIYTSPSVFPNPQRVRLLMLEKGIHDQFEEVLVNMIEKGDQRGWKHLKVNPWGETPALILEDGTCLSETTAICHYLDEAYPGRKVMGETALEKGIDQQWDMRVWVHCLYRLTTTFHVKHEGLGHALELTHNPQWGEHCRKEAVATAGMLDRHLSDGRDWLAGGKEPGLGDITLCTAIAFGKWGPMKTDFTHRFEHIDHYWQRWQKRESFQKGYADGGLLPELDYLKKGKL